MGKFATKAAECAKSIETACGMALMFGTLVLANQDKLPQNVVYYVGIGIALFTVFRTWLVANKQNIVELADDVEDLYEGVRQIFPQDQPIPQYAVDEQPEDATTQSWAVPYGDHAREE